MLRRFKSASPKLRILLGVWLAAEILAIPAAAAIAMAGFTTQPDIIAEPVASDTTGSMTYVVTHLSAFSVAARHGEGEITIEIQNASGPLRDAERASACVDIDTPHLRQIGSVSAPDETYATTIVTLTFDPNTQPDFTFETEVMAPIAPACEGKSA